MRGGGTYSSRIFSIYSMEFGAGLDGSVGGGISIGMGATLLWEMFGSRLDVDPRMVLALRVSRGK